MDEPKKVKRVYGIFQDFFGDENVDLQKERDLYNILIHWKEVKVENEEGDSTTVYDLFAKVGIDGNGNIPMEYIGFLLNRATYTKEQFLADYMHSHIQGINIINPTTFLMPCLGNGPIKETITTLKNNSDSTIWMLFCEELDNYVHVESISGIPWRRIHNIRDRQTQFSEIPIYGESNCDNALAVERPIMDFTGALKCDADVMYVFKDFIKCFIWDNKPRYSYINGVFVMTYSYYDYMIAISKSLIRYINRHPEFFKSFDSPDVSEKLLWEVKIKNRMFYPLQASQRGHTISQMNEFKGKSICTFKGEEVKVKIIETSKEDAEQIENNRQFILNFKTAAYIKTAIEQLINFRYNNGRDRSKNQLWQNCKNVRYI